MPRDTIRSLNPLSETEARTLQFLLDKSAQTLPAAVEQRAKEREKQRKLQAKLDRMAAEEARRSKALAELRVDIDCVSAEIFKIAKSGVEFRHVAGKLQELGDLIPKQSFFDTPFNTLDRDQIQLLGELALEMYQASTKPRSSGRPLREKMADIKIDVGQDAPGEGGAAPDNRSALAAAIIAAGRRRRGEIT